jgi:hypothetical protein
MSIDKRGIGHVIAPWPFLIFGVVSLIGTAIFCPWFGLARGIMVAFGQTHGRTGRWGKPRDGKV